MSTFTIFFKGFFCSITVFEPTVRTFNDTDLSNDDNAKHKKWWFHSCFLNVFLILWNMSICYELSNNTDVKSSLCIGLLLYHSFHIRLLHWKLCSWKEMSHFSNDTVANNSWVFSFYHSFLILPTWKLLVWMQMILSWEINCDLLTYGYDIAPT